MQDGVAKPVQALIQLSDYKPVAKLAAVQKTIDEDSVLKVIQKLEYLIQTQGQPTHDWKALNSKLASLNDIHNAVSALAQISGTMFKESQKITEEAAKIPQNVCSKCASALLRDLADQLG